MEDSSGISVAWIPVAHICVLSLGTLASFLTAYSIGDVTIYLPYISETGGWPPESCVFTLTLILGSFLGVLVVLVRYLIVADCAEEPLVLSINKKALYVGLISWLGLAIVGAFPMSTVLSVHLIGAGLHFCLGLVYIALQTIICHKIIPMGDKLRVLFKLRIILCGFLLFFLVFLLILFPIAQFKWKKIHGEQRPAKKIPEETGFDLIIASSFFEWALYIVFLTYFATFLVEFRNYRLTTSVRNSSPAKENDATVQNPGRILF